MILDLHIHSKYSFDSMLRPEKIIKVSKKKDLDGIAITDHDTIKGGVQVKKMNKSQDFLVIVGSEVNTEMGDIIGLFLNEEIKSRDGIEVLEEIKQQGGISILPHPYRGHRLSEEVMEKVDAIEVFNARTDINGNEMAMNLSKKYKKPIVAGSDAHFISEIGLGKTIIDYRKDLKRDILNGKNKLETYHSPDYFQPLSQIIKSIKTNRFRSVPFQSASFILQLTRR